MTRAFKAVCLLAAAALPLMACGPGYAQQGGAPGTIPPEANVAGGLLADYRAVTQALERARIYNNHLEKLVADQERDKVAKQRALDSFASVEQGIVPLMINMIDGLEAFIELDLPFSLSERRQRVLTLRGLMGQADIPLSEKYRRIMEAYQVETAFGRDVETYSDWLETGEVRREVDFFRLGRLLLTYQTRDRVETGVWNAAATPPGWTVLPDEYRSVVAEGIRIARKQAAPELLKLPVAAPKAVQ